MNKRIVSWLKNRSRRRARGFSLLELVVVIGIIMALAGILTLTLPDLLGYANQSSTFTNIKLCDDMIQSWAAVNSGRYPTGWDSLIDTSDLYNYLPTNITNDTVGTSACNKSIKALTLDAVYVERLKRAGITTVCDMTKYTGSSTNAINASYMAADVSSPRGLATGGTIAQVDITNLPTDRPQMEFLSTHAYAIFGVGRGTQKLDAAGAMKQRFVGVGGFIKDQPIAVHEEGCTSPKTVYCVPCAIFDLGVTSTGTLTSRDSTVARYIGTVVLGDNGFIYSENIVNKLGQ